MKKQQQQQHQETKAIQYAVRITDSLNNSILKLCKDTNTKRSEFIHQAIENAIEGRQHS